MSPLFHRLRSDEKGASLLEYSILIGILLVMSMATISGVGNWVNTQWVALNTNLTAN
jgi:pilus assembly protein Flp/PilA